MKKVVCMAFKLVSIHYLNEGVISETALMLNVIMTLSLVM